MPGVNKKPTSKSFNAVTPHRRSARRLCTSAPRPTGSCYGTKPTRGTLDLHHSKYNDTKLTRKSVTYVVELKCYPCEWRAGFRPLTHHRTCLLWHTAVSRRVIGPGTNVPAATLLSLLAGYPVNSSALLRGFGLAPLSIFQSRLRTFQYFLALLL